MNYSDGNIIINQEFVTIRSGILPKVGVLSIPFEHIVGVELMTLSLVQRFTLFGTNNFKTFYAIDFKRPLKGEAIKIQVSAPLGPFSEFVINPDQIDLAIKVIKLTLENR